MCNWSEAILEKERINAIERMIQAGATKNKSCLLATPKKNLQKQSAIYVQI